MKHDIEEHVLIHFPSISINYSIEDYSINYSIIYFISSFFFLKYNKYNK